MKQRPAGQTRVYLRRGLSAALIVSAVKTLGAAEIVCADISPRSLSLAQQMGADTLINPQGLADEWKRKGYFDVSFQSLRSSVLNHHLLEVTRAKGVMVQVGMGGAGAGLPG